MVIFKDEKSTYANELLHVVCGGSAELFLKNLFNDGGETIAEAITKRLF